MKFSAPPGTSPTMTFCKSCKAPVFWVVTPAGKRMPVDPTGDSHFATCPNANAHRKKKAPNA